MKNFLLLFSIFLIIGCASEKPVSVFEFTKSDDGTVIFKNASKNAVSYQWDFGDGTYDTSESPNHKFEKNGKYNVKLTSTNETGNHSSMVTIEIDNVELANYLFWTKHSKYLPIEIYIEGALHSNVRKSFSDTPECWTSGAVTVDLPAGTYKFSARGRNGAEWSESDLNFEKGICKSVHLN